MPAKPVYEYATKSWPIANGCSPSMPCAPNCWAMRTVNRLAQSDNPKIRAAHEGLVGEPTCFTDGPMAWTGVVRLNEGHLTDPLHWRQPQRVAVAYHGDLFRLGSGGISQAFEVMRRANWHTYLVLTKQVAAMAHILGSAAWWAGTDPAVWKHVWLGVSCANQAEADARIPLLLQTPAAVRWVSLEPLVGAVDLTAVPRVDLAGVEPGTPLLHWVVLGGESGPAARPMHPDWARSLRDQCQAAGVPFFFKQWGEWGSEQAWMARCDALQLKLYDWPQGVREGDRWRAGKRYTGRLLDGREYTEMPEVLR